MSQDPEGTPIELYFLYSDKNYIILQGINYCASFRYYDEDGNKVIYKDPIVNQYGSASVNWDGHSLEDYGGYCFSIFFEDDEDGEKIKPNKVFKGLQEKL